MSDAPSFTALDQPMPGAILPEQLAAKLAAVRQLELPQLAQAIAQQTRLVESLWCIQHMSMQPGGLSAFARDLAAFALPRFGTPFLRKFGSRPYSADECLSVWEEIPKAHRGDIEDKLDQTYGYVSECADLLHDEGATRWEVSERARRAELLGEKTDRLGRAAALEKLLYQRNEPFLRQLCQQQSAVRHLEEFFQEICTARRESPSLWFCPDVLAEVNAFMDQRAPRIRERIATTAVAEKVFDALDYACTERVMVRIEGDSRFGKSESVETYAAMWPGRVRVVRTPSSNNEKDLFKAIAEALGIHHGYGTVGHTLKNKVEFTLRFSGLMIVFDEAAFLIPSNFSATTPPARLNWVRTAIVDRKLPCVLVVTPQSYHGAVERFVKKTKYSIEQFLGREALRVSLPNELAHEDLLAVARIHFPGADEDLLGLVASMALQSESYLKAVENIARQARFNAGKRRAANFNLADVELAISEVMPSAATAPAATSPAPAVAAVKKSAARPARSRSRAAEVLQAPFRGSAKEFPAREIVPLNALPEGAETLATG